MTTLNNDGMKHSVSKETEAYLQQLEASEKAEKEVATKSEEYSNYPDALDQLIQTHNLRIEGLHFYPKLDLILVVLNNGKVTKQKLSDFKKLHNASQSDLENYKLSRYGVHWPELDEDLSLKGFLQYELAHADRVLAA